LVRRLALSAGATGTAPLSPALAWQVEQDCVRQVLECLVGAMPAPAGMDLPITRRQALRRAEDYIEANLGAPITVQELCAETDVSERTLDYAFRDRFGLGPMAYYKARRLNAARHELKRTDSAESAVHQVAARWGFWHTGAFAADYRRQFGELPSETLRGGPARQGRPAAPGPALTASGAFTSGEL
jgi:transcriptional regulator GlxA family with amidase domain